MPANSRTSRSESARSVQFRTLRLVVAAEFEPPTFGRGQRGELVLRIRGLRVAQTVEKRVPLKYLRSFLPQNLRATEIKGFHASTRQRYRLFRQSLT